jgi:dephospho-CoA kinase
MKIIGITGTIGSGKGTVVRHLIERYGFVHHSARDLIVAELAKAGLPANRDTMLLMANKLRKENHPGYIAEALHLKALEEGKDAVIESIRTVGEIEAVKRHGNFHLFAVDADPRIRYARIRERQSVTDNVSFEKFLADEREETSSPEAHVSNLLPCIARADHIFMNDGSLEDLQAQVDRVMARIREA